MLYYSSGKPSPPKNLRVSEVNKDYVVLTWEAPDSDGGSPITEYTIEKCDTGRMNYINAGRVDGKTLSFKVTKLTEGNEYLFKVYAENKQGQSEPAKTDSPVKAKLPFGK